MTWEGRVEAIYISEDAAQPLHAVDKIKAVPGVGLEGDRYFHKRGTFSHKPATGRDVTLIEIETIEALRRAGLDIDPGDPRRNIVTRDVPLNHLVGRRFKVGDATLEGMRLCEPCSHLTKLTSKEIFNGLVHRGGLRAEIVEGAELRPGDAIQPIDQADAETR